MTISPSEDGGFVLQLSRRERVLLRTVLELYPLIPASHHRLSRTADPGQIAADQKLLEEALTAQKQENHRHLRTWLAGEGGFKPRRGGFTLTLNGPQLDWFLQVLNDVRVGSWLKLDCPDERNGRPVHLTPANARYYFAMQYCGMVQSLLLQGMNGDA